MIIPKGFHRALPPKIGLHIGKKHYDKLVKFDQSCAYNLKDADQYDTNKLFGVGFFFHHTYSARFGWRYDLQSGKIVISAYCYVKGERVEIDLCVVRLEKWVRCYLYVGKDHYFFSVVDNATQTTIATRSVNKGHRRQFSYPLGCYFGGNKTAPHTMKIQMQSL